MAIVGTTVLGSRLVAETDSQVFFKIEQQEWMLINFIEYNRGRSLQSFKILSWLTPTELTKKHKRKKQNTQLIESPETMLSMVLHESTREQTRQQATVKTGFTLVLSCPALSYPRMMNGCHLVVWGAQQKSRAVQQTTDLAITIQLHLSNTVGEKKTLGLVHS